MKVMKFNKLAVVALGFALSSALLWVYGRFEQSQASKVTRDTEAFVAAGQSDEAFQTIQREYGSRLHLLEGCSDSRCSYELDVNNRFYSWLHIAPFTDLNVRFDRGKKAGRVMVFYSVGGRIFVHVQADQCPQCKWFYVNSWQNSISTELWNGILHFASPPAMLRIAAFKINSKCLAKFGGCEDISEMLPSIWQRSPEGTVKCIISNQSGTVIDPD